MRFFVVKIMITIFANYCQISIKNFFLKTNVTAVFFNLDVCNLSQIDNCFSNFFDKNIFKITTLPPL
jgi:hypothetical protein